MIAPLPAAAVQALVAELVALEVERAAPHGTAPAPEGAQARTSATIRASATKDDPWRTRVLMTRRELERLPEYSFSCPTLIEIGKRWRVNRSACEAWHSRVRLGPAGLDHRAVQVREAAPEWWLVDVLHEDEHRYRLRRRRIELLPDLADLEVALAARIEERRGARQRAFRACAAAQLRAYPWKHPRSAADARAAVVTAMATMSLAELLAMAGLAAAIELRRAAGGIP